MKNKKTIKMSRDIRENLLGVIESNLPFPNMSSKQTVTEIRSYTVSYYCSNCGRSLMLVFEYGRPSEPKVCPICGVAEKQSLNLPKEAFVYKTGGIDDTTCLTRKCIADDLARGGSGVAFVSCPCPNCTPRF